MVTAPVLEFFKKFFKRVKHKFFLLNAADTKPILLCTSPHSRFSPKLPSKEKDSAVLKGVILLHGLRKSKTTKYLRNEGQVEPYANKK